MNTIKNKSSFTIRTAVVTRRDAGYIYLADISKEKSNIPYTKEVLWKSGKLEIQECNFDIRSACVAEKPEKTRTVISANGYYHVLSKLGGITGDIFDDSTPQSSDKRLYGIKSLGTVDEKAYAVGLNGMVYRLDAMDSWVRIDDGLPNDLNLSAIAGFDERHLYVAGYKGSMWLYNGLEWKQIEVPTNVNLLSAIRGDDNFIYVGGRDGVILKGIDRQWSEVCAGEICDHIWDLEWYEESLFISTMNGLFRFSDNQLSKVDFGTNDKISTYQLSKYDGVLWSNGERDVMMYDGKRWSRVY